MAGGAKDQGHDRMIGIFLLGILLLLIFWLIWYYFEYDIKNAIRWYRYGFLWLMQWVVDPDMQIPYGTGFLRFGDWLEGTPSIVYTSLTDDVMNQLAVLTLQPLKWFFVAILFACGLWALLSGPQTHFRMRHSLESLIRLQSRIFPVIAPFVAFNPNTIAPRAPGAPVPADLPMFAEALAPEEWLAFHHIPMTDNKPDRASLERAFSLQLGKPWRGPFHLSPALQILFAAFCLKASRKRTQSDDLLGELSACWSHTKGLRLTGALKKKARDILKNKDLTGSTVSKCNQHGYEVTAMLRALNTAREEGGVLAPGQFVWLRGYDRNLWYALNNLGRQAVHTEALGSMAHFKMEKITMRPVLTPKMDDAVQSMIDYMASDRARPIPKLDHSASKKWGGENPTSLKGAAA